MLFHQRINSFLFATISLLSSSLQNPLELFENVCSEIRAHRHEVRKRAIFFFFQYIARR